MAKEISVKSLVFTQQEIIDALIKVYIPNLDPLTIDKIQQYIANPTSIEVVFKSTEKGL